MIQWLVLLAVKILKFAIVGVVAFASSFERPSEAPGSPTSGGTPPCTGSAVMMRELGACDLPAIETVIPAQPGERLEVVAILRIETSDAA